MNHLIFFILLVSVYFIPCNSYSQRNKKPIVDKPKIDRPSPKPIKRLPAKSKNPEKRRIPSPDQKIRVDRGNSFIDRDNKIIGNRPPRRNPTKRKKPIVNNEPLLIVKPVQTIIIEEIPDEGFCIVDDVDYYKEIEISEYSYPEFPLRFSSANIFYQFTDRGEDYYKIIIDVEAFYNNYFQKFGVLLKYFNGQEQVVLFNENNEFLSLGERFKFHKQIKIQETGYINLRLGYFDDELKVFYPEDHIPNRTDIMIFLGNPERVNRYSNK